MMDRFTLDSVSVGYGASPILGELSLTIPADALTTIIGPNGCGKSTLLKALCGLLPHRGTIRLDDQAIGSINRRERARLIGMLPQDPVAPEGLTARRLIARGRFPHQKWYRQDSPEDDAAVERAVDVTGVRGFADRPIGSLSGGQRQRVWLAMTVAQDAATTLLDEPTTFLDLSRSVEILRVVRWLRESAGKTFVMVLHDLNLAARFSDHLIAMAPDGAVAATGTPEEVLTERLLADVFGLDAAVVPSPTTGDPLVVPR